MDLQRGLYDVTVSYQLELHVLPMEKETRIYSTELIFSQAKN